MEGSKVRASSSNSGRVLGSEIEMNKVASLLGSIARCGTLLRGTVVAIKKTFNLPFFSRLSFYCAGFFNFLVRYPLSDTLYLLLFE